jgi:hypothetical protein
MANGGAGRLGEPSAKERIASHDLLTGRKLHDTVIGENADVGVSVRAVNRFSEPRIRVLHGSED